MLVWILSLPLASLSRRCPTFLLAFSSQWAISHLVIHKGRPASYQSFTSSSTVASRIATEGRAGSQPSIFLCRGSSLPPWLRRIWTSRLEIRQGRTKDAFETNDSAIWHQGSRVTDAQIFARSLRGAFGGSRLTTDLPLHHTLVQALLLHLWLSTQLLTPEDYAGLAGGGLGQGCCMMIKFSYLQWGPLWPLGCIPACPPLGKPDDRSVLVLPVHSLLLQPGAASRFKLF